jgi:hypothetical protein
MRQTKRKDTAAAPAQLPPPSPPLRSPAETLSDPHNLKLLRTFKLILDRYTGTTRPVESFLVGLVGRYAARDAAGAGLTLVDIEAELSELQQDLPDAIRTAYFLADRYKRPEPMEQRGISEVEQ